MRTASGSKIFVLGAVDLGGLREEILLSIRGLERLDQPVRSTTGPDKPSFWSYVEPTWRASRVRMFATQGRSAGTPWPTGPGGRPYTREERRYAAFKSKAAGRSLTLADLMRWRDMLKGVERLYPSLTRREHPEYVWRQAPDFVEAGTKVPYAGRLQTGGRSGWGVRPARPVVGLGDHLLRALARRTGEYAALIEARIGLSTADVLSLVQLPSPPPTGS